MSTDEAGESPRPRSAWYRRPYIFPAAQGAVALATTLFTGLRCGERHQSPPLLLIAGWVVAGLCGWLSIASARYVSGLDTALENAKARVREYRVAYARAEAAAATAREVWEEAQAALTQAERDCLESIHLADPQEPASPKAVTSYLAARAAADRAESAAALLGTMEEELAAASATSEEAVRDLEARAGRIFMAYLRRRREAAAALPQVLTSLAISLAGRRRSHLRDEWLTHLAGAPEEGIVLTRRQRRRYALGFLLSAVRMRLHDLACPLWRPVDWLLTTEGRTHAFITAAVGCLAVYICGTGGLHALLVDSWEPCTILGTGLFASARWLRRVRGIELAERHRGQDRST